MIVLIFVFAVVLLLGAWQAVRWRQRLASATRRRARRGLGAARQNQWGVVFGRSRQRRLKHRPGDDLG